jgi:hypothetical protein
MVGFQGGGGRERRQVTVSEAELADPPAARLSARRWSFLTRMDVWILSVFGLWLALVLIGLFVALHVLEPHLSLHNGFRTVVVNSDAGWLREIDVLGYQWNGNAGFASDIAFLPVYPLVVAGFHSLGLGWNGACFLVSVLCQGATLVLLGRLLASTGATRRQIRWSIGFALVYPAALFAVTGFGTTMLNLCVVGAVLLHRRGHDTWAFAVAGVATGLYYTGLAVPVALVVAQWRSGGLAPMASWRGVGRILLGFSAVIGYMAYLWARFGNPFASLADQRAWIGTPSIGTILKHAVTLHPVVEGFLGYIAHRQEPDLSHLFDAPFLLVLVIAALWLLFGRHGIETWLLAVGGLIILYQSTAAGYPFGVIRLAYPFFIVLPMNPRVRALIGRVRWTLLPYLGCLAISCYWITILAQRLYTD